MTDFPALLCTSTSKTPPDPFIYLKPQNGTPFGRSLPVQDIRRSTLQGTAGLQLRKMKNLGVFFSGKLCTKNFRLHNRKKKGDETNKLLAGKSESKEKVKKKNSCRRKVQLWLFQKVWVSFRKSEVQKSTILPGTMMNKQKSLSSYELRRQLEPCFCLKLQLVYLQHTLYNVL